MRRRNSRKSNAPQAQSPTTIARDTEDDAMTPDPVSAPVAASVPWSVEQLHALGPVTGPNHRTSVPIVRSKATSPGDQVDGSIRPTEISFVSEGMESWIGRDSR
jgi:hypothetical protein